jgi:integrase
MKDVARRAGGRPATGCPKWNERKGVWEARVTLASGQRKSIAMSGIPREDVDRARYMAKLLSTKVRASGVVTMATRETVSEWFERYFDWREGRPQAVTIEDRRSRITKWVVPVIGAVPMVDVTPDDLRKVARHLEVAISEEEIAWKTAQNIWGDVTKGFADASEVNDETIRVRQDNPCEKVRGPARGDERSKPFLRPEEIVALLSCGDVPVHRRRLYAVAAYTACRIGELRALTAADIDFGAMQITVVKQATATGTVKARTKTGRARVIPIEPALAPLLAQLVKERPKGPILGIRNEAHAELLREALTKAGCTRPALSADDDMRAPMVFHGLRDTCLSHMAVRRDPPQDVQWRAGHTTPAMTEKYVAQARFAAGPGFGVPFPPLPLEALWVSASVSDFGFVRPVKMNNSELLQRPQRELNPCSQRERLVS